MVKCKFNLGRVSVAEFSESTRHIQTKLSAPMFSTVLPSPSEVLPYIDQMDALQEQIRDGYRGLIGQRDALRRTINGLVSRQCICVSGFAGGDLAILNASGFETAKQPEPKPVPSRIETVSVSNGLNSGDVNVEFSASKHRTSYIIQMMLPGSVWQTVHSSTKRNVTISNVPEKEFAYFRVGAINASGQGDWSIPVRLLVGK